MVDAAKHGMILWAIQLVPSLFPFMILSNLFLKLSYRFLNFQNAKTEKICQKLLGLSLYGCYIFILGQFCGYPLGARMTAAAYGEQKITRSEADYLMTICNQSSPAFLEYYVGSYSLSNAISGRAVILLFLLGTLLTSLITRKLCNNNPRTSRRSTNPSYEKEQETPFNLFTLLDQGILESCLTMLRVGGYVILFSILSDFLLKLTLLPASIRNLAAASLEISNGLFLLKDTFSANSCYPYLVITLSAFGGFCTMAQIKGMLVGTSLSIKSYVIGKMIYTSILLVLTAILFQIKII